MILRFENFQNSEADFTKPVIDRSNLRIEGVCAMHTGEALGHAIMADSVTLSQMAMLGNNRVKGVRGRFGHPGLSENATGKQVQIARNFEVSGNKLIHTSQLLETARKSPAFPQDPVEFILDLAENNPTEFGESVVIEANLAWVLVDGSERELSDKELPGPDLEKPADAINKLPAIRPTEFHYVDFVNEGALTYNGMFAPTNYDNLADMNMFMLPGSKTSYITSNIFAMLDNFRRLNGLTIEQMMEIAPAKIQMILASYRKYRNDKYEPKPTQEINMSGITETVKIEEELVSSNPKEELVSNKPAEGATDDLSINLSEASSIINTIEDDNSDDAMGQFESLMLAIAQLQSDQAALQAEFLNQLNQIRSYMTELSKALVGQAKVAQLFDREIKQLKGERIVTGAVPRAPKTLLENLAGDSVFSFESPKPSLTDIVTGQDETPDATMRQPQDLSILAWNNKQSRL